MLTHRALAANVKNLSELGEDRMGPEDIVLGVLPMFHAFGLNAVLGWAVATGAALIIDQRFDSAHTLDLISKYGVTRLPLAPPALHALLARPDLRDALRTVKVVLTGASTLDRALADRFEQATGMFVHQGYGLTEASPGSPRPSARTTRSPVRSAVRCRTSSSGSPTSRARTSRATTPARS